MNVVDTEDSWQGQSAPENPVKTSEQLRKMIGDCAGCAFSDPYTLRLILFDIVDTFAEEVRKLQASSTE